MLNAATNGHAEIAVKIVQPLAGSIVPVLEIFIAPCRLEHLLPLSTIRCAFSAFGT